MTTGPNPSGNHRSRRINVVGKFAAPAICCALVGNAWAAGWWGLDYGGHWDEWYLVAGLTNAIKDLTLLPREYTYGGMYFNIGFLLLLPQILSALPDILGEIAKNPVRPLAIDGYPALVAARDALIGRIHHPGFVLEARIAFMTIVSLASVWTYLTLRRMFPGNAWAAVAGTAFMACSWEVGYHARFIAVDAVLMQFCALTLLLTAQALDRHVLSRIVPWLAAAALAAGLTFGCKLPGLFMVVPVLLAGLIHPALPWTFRFRITLAFVILRFLLRALYSPHQEVSLILFVSWVLPCTSVVSLLFCCRTFLIL
jgi:hypothetical protein